MPFIKEYNASVNSASSVQTEQAPLRAVDGLEALAAGVDKMSHNFYHRDLEKDDADTLSAIAKLKADLAQRRSQAVIDGTAANSDWMENEHTYAADQIGTLAGGLRTNDGRRAAQVRGDQLLGEESQRWISTQATVAAQLQKNNLQSVEDLTLRAIQEDPATHGAAAQQFLGDMDGPAYSRLSKDVKEDYARQFKYKAARTMLEGTEQTYGSEAALFALPSLRDQMPAEQYQSLLDHYTQRAKQEKNKDKEQEKYKLLQNVDDLIKTGGNPVGIIDAGVKNELLSADKGMELRHEYDKYVEHQQKIADADQAFRIGDMISFDQSESKIKTDVANAWLAEKQAQFQAATDPADKKAIANAIAHKGVEMDYVFPGLRDTLRAAPEGPNFKAAVDLYKSMNAFDPYYASKYVSEEQRARFDVYSTSVEGGATAEQATALATQITPHKVAEARRLLTSPDGKDLRKSIQDAMTDKPYWFTGDMVNGQQAANEVMKQATLMLAGNPAADLKAVTATAQKAYEDRNVRLGSVWVPRGFISGVPSDNMVEVTNRVISELPTVLKANKLPVMDGAYALAPDGNSAQDKRLQVYDPSGFPVPGLRFGPSDFQSVYRAMQVEKYDKARSKKSAPVDQPLTPLGFEVQ